MKVDYTYCVQGISNHARRSYVCSWSYKVVLEIEQQCKRCYATHTAYTNLVYGQKSR